MKNPFKSDPQVALDKTIRKLTDVEANIVALQASRTEKLASTEDISEIQQIDRSIEAERTAAEIYRDRIRVLENEVRREKYRDREKQRAAAIDKIGKKFAQREQVAESLEKVINRVSELYFEMTEPLALQTEWPFEPPSYGLLTIDLRAINREMGWALWGMLRPREGRPTLPMPNNFSLGVTGINPIGIAGAVKQQATAVLNALTVTDIRHDMGDAA